MHLKRLITAAAACLLVAVPLKAQGLPGPDWVSIRDVSVVDIVDYARALPWAGEAWNKDVQHMLFRSGDRVAIGPVVELSARRDVETASLDELGDGRFVARFRTSGRIQSMGLTAGATYVWMERDGDRWMATLFPEPRARSELYGTGLDEPGDTLLGRVPLPRVPLTVVQRPMCAPVGASWEPLAFSREGFMYRPCWPCDCAWCCMELGGLEWDYYRGPLPLPPDIPFDPRGGG